MRDFKDMSVDLYKVLCVCVVGVGELGRDVSGTWILSPQLQALLLTRTRVIFAGKDQS